MNAEHLERNEEFFKLNSETVEEKTNEVVSARFAYIENVTKSSKESFSTEDDVLKFFFENVALFYTNQLISDYTKGLASYEIETISFYKHEILNLHSIYFKACNNFNYDNHRQSIHAIIIMSQYSFNQVCLERYLLIDEKLNFNADDNSILDIIKNSFYSTLINNIANNEADKELIYKLSLILYVSLAIHLAVYYIVNSRKKNSIKTFSTISEALFVLKNGRSREISNYIKKKMAMANEARWQGHVEHLRRKYLELDKQRQSKLGKNLTIKSVATWIYEHHNQDDLEYETIRDHLSKARRGIFTNE